jgi:hypothetical protein
MILQTGCQIVDAEAGFVLFALGNQMNWKVTEAGLLNHISRANSFRACFRSLIGPLLVQRVDGPFMTVSIEPT